MLWPGLKKLGKELQLKRTNSEVVGEAGNCLVKLYDGANMKVLEIFAPELGEGDQKVVTEKLNVYKIQKFEWLPKGVKIIFPEYFHSYSIKKIRSVLDDLTEYFRGKYPGQRPSCQKCGLSKPVEAYSLGTGSLFMCSDCLQETENSLSSECLEYDRQPNNYLAGFTGALLFSIPGIIVTTLFFVFLERLAGFSAVLYVILGIKGYKQFKGKISPFGAFLIVAAAVIMTGLGIVIAYSVAILKELETVDLNILLLILGMPEIQRELVQNILTGYAVSGIYLVVQLAQMTKEWNVQKIPLKAQDIL